MMGSDHYTRDAEVAMPFGDDVWVLERRDGVLYGVWTSRHDVIGFLATEVGYESGGVLQSNNPDWFEIECVKAGEIPMAYLRVVDNE